MADVAARREARRRKILENSQNRLKLITGEQNGSLTETENFQPKIQNFIEKNIEPTTENHIHNELLNNLLQGSDNFSPLLAEIIPDSSNEVNYVKYSKLYVISLAIIIRLLFIFQMQFCVRDSIILPFIIFELTLQFFNSNSENRNAFLSTFLILSSLPPNRIKLITRILTYIETFTTDFCLYFFTFMVLHVFLEFFI